MASERVIGDSHHYDVASVKPQLEATLGSMARELGVCKHRGRSQPVKTFSTSVVPAVPKCAACHDSKRTTATSPALQPGPKRVSTDPTIARQPPAFTPFPERRRTPRDTGRSTSSGSDQVSPRGAPAGSSSSAMDRLGGSGSSSPASGGGGSGGGSAGRPSSASGGAASGGSPSANNPAPNINSNTIMKQAPAFGQSPGLR